VHQVKNMEHDSADCSGSNKEDSRDPLIDSDEIDDLSPNGNKKMSMNRSRKGLLVFSIIAFLGAFSLVIIFVVK